MNHDTIPPVPPADPELEARIVAWVAGEASAFEIETLQAAIAAHPELAVFKRRIEAVHGLVAEAARPDRAPLRLTPERRAKLLQTIGVAESGVSGSTATTTGPRAASARGKVVVMPGAKKPKQPFWTQHWFYSAAACVVIGALGLMMTVPAFQKVRLNRPAPDSIAFDLIAPMEEAGSEMNEERQVDSITVVTKGGSPPQSWSVSVPGGPPDKQYKAERNQAPRRPQLQAINARAADDFAATAKGDIYGSPAANAPSAAPAKRQANQQPTRPAAPADENDVVVLSPFVVASSDDAGYGATSTLAGTRVRTELKDTSSTISVGTDRFLKDTGATGSKSLLEYAPKTEAAGQSDGFLAKRKSQRPVAAPKRPEPSATSAGMGPGAAEGSFAGLEQKQKKADRSDRSAPTDQSDKPVITGADSPTLDHPQPPPPTPPTIEEVSAAQEAVSTFSLHVSDVSFKLALASLASGTWPDRATIRPEEFYNAFDYGDPATAASEKISCRVEQAAHLFAQQRNLVRIAIRVPATGRGAGQPLHLTVLLDTSGSMERPDRRATVRAALATLVGLLGPADRLTLIGFARQPRLLAEALDGNHANQALDLLDRTPAEGGTNLEEALRLGSELARRQYVATAQNRIVLLTDGAANLGAADPERLAAAVESLRAQRIAFDACGVGLDGLDDTILEALTRKGDGRYYVLNSAESADAGFARQIAGALRPAAENVKVQVRFNPSRVGRYRLVGFEKHRLREEDFRNDSVDAAELAAEEAAVAVYEIEAKPQGEGDLGEVFVRFRDAATKAMVERSWALPYEARAAAFDRAAPSLQLAGTAAMLAEKLRGGPAGDRVELDTLAPIVNALRGRHPDDKRLQELATMFEQMRKLQGK